MDNTPTAEADTDAEHLPAVLEREKVFQFQPRASDVPAETAPAERRDWAAAIDLIAEASEAVRWAEERAQNAEDYAKQLAAFHKEQLKSVEQRLTAAEKRAEAALLRAAEAEAWLARFHDAIVTGFGKTAKELAVARS